MSLYAQGTSVPVERSKTELERVLARYGAEAFAYFSEPGRAAIAFKHKGRAIRVRLPLPKPADFASSPTGRARTAIARETECDRATRARWRALLLVVKAKLEAVESGIATFEDEWLAYMVLPDGKTVGERLVPQLDAALAGDALPLLLGLDEEEAS